MGGGFLSGGGFHRQGLKSVGVSEVMWGVWCSWCVWAGGAVGGGWGMSGASSAHWSVWLATSVVSES